MTNYWQKTRLYHLIKKDANIPEDATLWGRSHLYHLLKKEGIINDSDR